MVCILSMLLSSCAVVAMNDFADIVDIIIDINKIDTILKEPDPRTYTLVQKDQYVNDHKEWCKTYQTHQNCSPTYKLIRKE